MDLLAAMRAYIAVIRAGSQVGAADLLGSSTAAVSRQIAALEDHLGVRLLNRTTRRLSMTDAGQDFLARAQQILSDVADAEAAAGQGTLHPSGLLRISAPTSFGLTTLSHWLAPFILRYPDLRLDIDLTDRVIDLAEEGVDVAVRIARQPATTNVISRRIMAVTTVVCAAPGYLDRRGRPHTPADLGQHDILSYSYLSTGDTWTFHRADRQEESVRLNPGVHASNGDILCELALQGLGIINQPDFIVAPHLASGALEPVLQEWSMEGFNLYAIYLSRKFLSAKVRLFIDHLSAMATDPSGRRQTGPEERPRPGPRR